VANSFSYAPYQIPNAGNCLTSPASSNVTATSAIVTSNVWDGGAALAGAGDYAFSCSFEVSTDPGFGSSSGEVSNVSVEFAPWGFLPAAPSMMGLATGTVIDLTPSTRYYFRVTMTNALGTGYGAVGTFETSTNVPTLVSPLQNGGVANGPVTFTWLYNPGGAGGGQTGYCLQITGPVPGQSGNGPWYWTGSGWSGTATWITSTAQTVTIPASFFDLNTRYSWTVATEDANGQGPFA
jgi:hypothetical protein